MSFPIRNRSDELAIDRGCEYQPEEAERVLSFVRRFCRLSKGVWAGKPIELIPWQVEMISSVYGWFNQDGTRRFRNGFVMVPKKSGKSGLYSALGIYATMADREQGAEVICAARNRAQAAIVYDEAAKMVQASPQLKKHLRIIPYQKRITHEASNSVFKALSADHESHEGINMSMGICDELHAWLGNKSKLYGVLRYAGAARRSPLLLSITTAGRDRNSICYQLYKYSRAVERGDVVDHTHYSQIYEAPEDCDYRDPQVWRLANPSLGYTISEQDLADNCAKAQNDPIELEDFLQYRLNMWLAREDAWLKPGKWALGDGPVCIPANSDVFIGADLSSTQDITAVVVIYQDPDGYYHVVPYLFMPSDTAEERNHRDGIPFLAWAEQGYITLIPGPVIDYDYIERKVVELSEQYQIRKIFMDKWNAAQLAGNLVDLGLEVEYVGQGIRLSPHVKETERLINSGMIRHGGHPVLAWMANNTTTRSDGVGNKAIQKPGDRGPLKVDGIVAMCMGVGACLATEPANTWDGRVAWL